MADCWVCGSMADKWDRPEARLCPQCWSQPLEAIQSRGFALTLHPGASVEVQAPEDQAPIITLAFRAESYGSIVKKLIKKELQIGRQDVDDQVYFEIASEDDLPFLKGYETSQLMATLSRIGAVEISNGHALVQIQDKKADPAHVAAYTASLLHFIRARQG